MQQERRKDGRWAVGLRHTMPTWYIFTSLLACKARQGNARQCKAMQCKWASTRKSSRIRGRQPWTSKQSLKNKNSRKLRIVPAQFYASRIICIGIYGDEEQHQVKRRERILVVVEIWSSVGLCIAPCRLQYWDCFQPSICGECFFRHCKVFQSCSRNSCFMVFGDACWCNWTARTTHGTSSTRSTQHWLVLYTSSRRLPVVWYLSVAVALLAA